MAESQHLLHGFDDSPVTMERSQKTKGTYTFLISVLIGALLFGLTSGYLLSFFSRKQSGSSLTNSKSGATDESSPMFSGLKDTKTFPDSAEGLLKEGGIEGEGSFHLERPGGASKNVYLTSTTVDLSVFVGKKVKVLGKTYEAQHAGWLMDVGYIELN